MKPMRQMKRTMTLLSAVFSMTLMGSVNATTVVLSAIDPVGDQFVPSPDLVQMKFVFDNVTGAYVIELETTNEDPFIGDFRVNINLFNLDAGTTAVDPSFFRDTLNDFSLTESTTTLALTGTNDRLQAWKVGDRILLNNLPSGMPSPDGTTLFRSGVDAAGSEFLEEEDMLGLPGQIDIVSAVPIPPAIWLFGSGLLGLLGMKRRKKALFCDRMPAVK